jgi:membrane protease YdiL (CAAX protease family)
MWFAVPGLAMLIGTEIVNPRLVAAGVPLIWSFTALFYGPLLLVGIAALIAFRRDGYSWSQFGERMRFQRMTRRDWLWGLGAAVAVLLIEGIIAEPLAHALSALPLFTPPPALPPLLDPNVQFELPPTSFFGAPLAGNLWVAGVYAVGLFANIAGEEVAWRGYLLPRMEQTHGRFAWLANGLLWIFLLHAVMRWNYLGLLPTGLVTPWVAQRTGNSWTAVMIHGLGNSIFLVLILMGIFTR